jgi:penicillin-binding protein 1B
LRIRINRGFWTSRVGLGVLGAALLAVLIGFGGFTYYWVKFSRMIDARLADGAFQATARVFTAPTPIFVGQALTPNDLVAYLQRSGYQPATVSGAPGRYTVNTHSVEIWPSPQSFFAGKNHLRVDFSAREISSISAYDGGGEVSSAELEPELLTNLFDQSREKRRPQRYDDLPKVLVDAVLSAEDKRFFEHPGFDPLRILGAAWADVRRERVSQGASTLTMQVARSFFFSLERTGWAAWRRKLSETLVALELEHRYNKQQIFELYANEIYLGNRGSFAIHGFGEGAQAYFGKDVRDLSVGEAAFLAGIIRAPNRYSSSDRHPERATEARNRVLAQMVENGSLSLEAEQATMKTSLRLVSGSLEPSAAPYFVDMVKDHLLDRFTENDLLANNYRIYTTLDPALQRAAAVAVDLGVKNVDTLLAGKYARWKREAAKAQAAKKEKAPEAVPQAQVALVAMDPRTGEIKALVGGRDYGQSQLNHALARRQPGSVFKPFVYAAAFDDAVDGGGPVVTTTTTVVDEPTTFEFDGKEYTPNNFGENFYGQVTLREALIHSLNVATVKVAELVGYGRVVEVARQIGLDPRIQPTPAVALGAYEMTPVDVAAGYTVFANGGVRAEPVFLRRVVGADGRVLERNEPRTRQALDPRVAYVVTNVLQDVVNRGTGAAVRARGFTGPAAGKTGTSRDGWFAGFTSNLLCIIWVGFDDNRDLGLSGTAAAAPIWAEFMKRAVTLPAYKDTRGFAAPEGVSTVTIDPETLQLATPLCPTTREEVFISGTEPTEYCSRHGGRMAAVSAAPLTAPVPAETTASPAAPGKAAATPLNSPEAAKSPGKAATKAAGSPRTPAKTAAAQPPPPEEKKKGLLERIFGIFGGGKKTQEKPKPPPGKQ